MTHLFLARHGETNWNAARRIQGQNNSSVLSERGCRQAQALAGRLSRLPIQAIYASDLTRALDTAAPLAALLGLPVVPTPKLRERSFGDWEGLTFEEVKTVDPEGWRHYYELHEFDAPVPNGETWGQVQTRMAEVLQQVLTDHSEPDVAVLLIGHGGSLRTLITDALGTPLSTIRHLALDNTSLSRLDFLPDRPARLALLNDTSHLGEDG